MFKANAIVGIEAGLGKSQTKLSRIAVKDVMEGWPGMMRVNGEGFIFWNFLEISLDFFNYFWGLGEFLFVFILI